MVLRRIPVQRQDTHDLAIGEGKVRQEVRGASESGWIEFQPRPSYGRYWVGGLGIFVLAIVVLPFVVTWGEVPFPLVALFWAIGILVSGPLLVIAWYFPRMRYWVGPEELVLTYGPLMRDRIRLDSLTSVRRRTLRISLLASFRFPGLALFYVDYMGVGRIRMCATSATSSILLLDDGETRYGITPDDEYRFVDMLVERAGSEIRVSENFNPERRSTRTTL